VHLYGFCALHENSLASDPLSYLREARRDRQRSRSYPEVPCALRLRSAWPWHRKPLRLAADTPILLQLWSLWQKTATHGEPLLQGYQSILQVSTPGKQLQSFPAKGHANHVPSVLQSYRHASRLCTLRHLQGGRLWSNVVLGAQQAHRASRQRFAACFHILACRNPHQVIQIVHVQIQRNRKRALLLLYTTSNGSPRFEFHGHTQSLAVLEQPPGGCWKETHNETPREGSFFLLVMQPTRGNTPAVPAHHCPCSDTSWRRLRQAYAAVLLSANHWRMRSASVRGSAATSRSTT